jgi:hypothetical protein
VTNKDRVLSVLKTAKADLCDDCLSNLSGIRPRQTVYTICRTLSDTSIILRHHGKCDHCRKFKLVSRLSTKQSFDIKVEASRQTVTSERSRTAWFWEGNVQAKVVDYLVKNGYVIRSVSDTALRAPGKDIVAITPDGNELWVSAKGYPEKSSNVQARHWFSGAVFDLLLYRGENPNVKLALALPDSFVTYINLVPRINWLKQTMPFEIFWVSEDGSVRRE